MTNKVRKLTLPFAVPAEDRGKAFTREMEMAAVFCLAEMERKKGGGILKRGETGEELLFTAKFCYPMWLIPWNGKSLLLDGLSITTYKLHYDTLPDVNAFINAIKISAKTCEAYSAFLSDSLNFFKNFTGEEERVIDGLVADPECIQDFSVYLKKARAIRKPLVDRALLSPALDETAISSIVQDLSDLRATLKDDIKKLREAMKLLSTATKKHIKAIRERIKETQKEFDEKIKSLESSLTKKVSRIRKRYDQEITRRTKEIDRRLHRLHQKRVKLEKILESTTAKIERCEAEIRSCRLHKGESGELRWKEELKTCREKLSLLERNIKDVDKEIEDATAAKTQEISKIRSECDKKIEAAMKEIRDIEAARDAKIRMSKKTIETLEDSTTTIVDQIDNLAGTKRAALDKLDGMGISKMIRKFTLVYLPFYLICYQKKLKNRYTLYPPSRAGNMGILTRFKGVFGVAKATSLLQPRSKIITTLLNGLLPLIEQNPMFEKETVDAGIKADILRTRDSCRKVRKGLEELEDEGWISESEFQAFSEFLAKT
jgi:archaellum component FlaC